MDDARYTRLADDRPTPKPEYRSAADRAEIERLRALLGRCRHALTLHGHVDNDLMPALEEFPEADNG